MSSIEPTMISVGYIGGGSLGNPATDAIKEFTQS
jgi:hypothetical protein